MSLAIGFFTDSYRPYTSGVVRSIETFTAHLRRLGHRVYIFAPRYPNAPPEEGVFRFASVPAVTQRDFRLALPLSLSLGNTVRRLKLDLIHVHSPFLLGSLGADAARRHGLPLVFTYHTLYDQYVHYVPFFPELSRRVVRQYTRRFCNRCDLVITPTTQIADLLRRQGVTAPLAVVPTGIELERFRRGDRNRLRQRYTLPPEAKILLYVGRLGREKNLPFLLKSFARLRRLAGLPPLRLVLVGGGNAEEETKRLAAELGVAEETVFTGTLPPEEVVHCYAGADLFVFASVTETQGVVLAEAKAAGLPVVAVDAAGVRDMVNSGVDGYLTALNLEEFTARVAELVSDESRRAAMARQTQVTVEEFSAERTAQRLAEHYQRLISGASVALLRRPG
ncbi:MAG: glycosyltransferase family 4 protein [Clostridia bacterium]|nr:glycosyltransferase family 4 protein [Clostridia bacterium]MDH7572731.1 glycosyltransferase family 4 protein [Clostridia bacterium]